MARELDKSYVKPFTEKIKIYLFKERKRVKMTVMVTQDYAITYLFDQEKFEDMINNWQSEWTGKALGTDIFIGPKVFKPTPDQKGEGLKAERFVRFSAFGAYGIEHRFSYNDMDELYETYYHQKNNVMHWDKLSD